MPTMSAMPLELMYSVAVKFRSSAPFGASSEYAVSSVASVEMSMCAGMSMTVAPFRRRTIARSAVSAISPSSEPHDQLDCVVPLVARDAELVDHVLDQEETPAARLLQSRELRFEIGMRRLGDLSAAAVIGDAHDHLGVHRDDLDPHGKLGASLVPVFDRVHRGLRHRGLEALEAPRGKADVTDARRDTLHRLTLGARDARNLEGVEHAFLRGPMRAHERDEGDVIFLLPPGSGETRQVTQQLVDEPLTAGVARAEFAHPREAEHVPRRVVRFGDAVAVEEDRLPGSEDRLLLFVGHVGHEPQRHAPGTQLANSRVAAHVRKIMAGVGVAQPARRRLEDRVEAGDEHVPRDVAVEEAGRTREHRRGRDAARRVATPYAAGRRPLPRRRNARPGDVSAPVRDTAGPTSYYV